MNSFSNGPFGKPVKADSLISVVKGVLSNKDKKTIKLPETITEEDILSAAMELRENAQTWEDMKRIINDYLMEHARKTGEKLTAANATAFEREVLRAHNHKSVLKNLVESIESKQEQLNEGYGMTRTEAEMMRRSEEDMMMRRAEEDMMMRRAEAEEHGVEAEIDMPRFLPSPISPRGPIIDDPLYQPLDPNEVDPGSGNPPLPPFPPAPDPVRFPVPPYSPGSIPYPGYPFLPDPYSTPDDAPPRLPLDPRPEGGRDINDPKIINDPLPDFLNPSGMPIEGEMSRPPIDPEMMKKLMMMMKSKMGGM